MKSSQLADCLKILKEYGQGRVVIVPGGGIFADHVRTAQTQWNFNDETAHCMALLAMEQYAYYCRSLIPEFEMATNVEQVNCLLKENKVVIFLPSQFMAKQHALPNNWSLTSDTIAAVISNTLKADGLVLIKSLDQIPEADSIHALAEAGVVDGFFPEYYQKLSCKFRCLVASDLLELKKIISG